MHSQRAILESLGRQAPDLAWPVWGGVYWEPLSVDEESEHANARRHWSVET